MDLGLLWIWIRTRCSDHWELLLLEASSWSLMVIVDSFLYAMSLLQPFSIFFFLITYSGLFPNHIPNPEDKNAMKAITQAVLDNKGDMGIIFDTDVDRFTTSTILATEVLQILLHRC
jgi:hypothetical protein